MVKVKNEELKSRLHNWKFESAMGCIDSTKEADEVVNTVEALAKVFGNVGWFGGALAIIIGQALESIGIKAEDI